MGYRLQVWTDDDVFGNDSYLRVRETQVRMPGMVLHLTTTSVPVCLDMSLLYRCGKRLASGVGEPSCLSFALSEKQLEAVAELR